MEAIGQAGSAIGILTKDGIVLAAEKRITSKLLDIRHAAEKMYKIDDHCAVAVAGITSDANYLIDFARLEAQRYQFSFQEPMPIEQLIQRICDLKQAYTQSGGRRPFGVSFLYAGWDQHLGFQLYQSDPSGNYGGWKARAIGNNNADNNSSLKDHFADEGKDAAQDEKKPKLSEISLDDAQLLALKILAKTLDTTQPTPDKMEFSTVTRVNGQVRFHIFTKEETQALINRGLDMIKSAAAEASSGDI